MGGGGKYGTECGRMKNAKEEEGKYGTKYSFLPYFSPPLESECFDQKVREIDKLVVGFGKGMQVRFWGAGQGGVLSRPPITRRTNMMPKLLCSLWRRTGAGNTLRHSLLYLSSPPPVVGGADF